MQKNLSKGLALVATVAALASSAFAGTLVLNTNTYSDALGGGEFTANNSGLNLSSYSANALLNGGFETFCMEYQAHFSPGSTYTFDTPLSNIVYSGDVASGGDPLSKGTSFLYSQFAKGILSGYFGGSVADRQLNAMNLQLAFWYLEDESSFIGGKVAYNGSTYSTTLSDNVFLNLLTNAGPLGGGFGSLADAKGNAAVGSYGVYALNLYSTTNSDAQSQLYYHVPEGGTVVSLLGLSLLGIAGFRRKLAARK